MNESSIICPQCGAVIELTEALTKKIHDDLRVEFNQKWIEEKKKLELQREEDKRAYESKLAGQKKQIEDQLKKQMEDQYHVQLKDFQNQLDEKSKRIKAAEEKELELLKRQRDLEDREQTLKLEMERRLAGERVKIQSELLERLSEEYKLKDAEKEKTISDLYRQIEDLKHKAELGSQQLQGEVLELELEGLLKRLFPDDEIEPVKKGVKGADIIQRVYNDYRRPCGVILWEAKRAKDWSKDWITKLKDDKLAAKSDIGVIVTTALPKGVSRIGSVENVWVCDAVSAEGLAMALRAGLIEIARAQSAKENMHGKMEIMYHYLSSVEFRQKIEAIADAFRQMKIDLDAEKTAMNRIWAKREKQMERVMMNTSQLYGSLQEIIGNTLQPISQLELPAGNGENTETKKE